jgi:hypothetical protein
MARAMSNGTGGGGMKISAQQLLQVYNGPPVLINELKSGAEIMRMPRLVLIGNIQTPVFESELGKNSVLFVLPYGCARRKKIVLWQNHSFPSTMKMPCPPKNQRQKELVKQFAFLLTVLILLRKNIKFRIFLVIATY